jgi:hypothetical protein
MGRSNGGRQDPHSLAPIQLDAASDAQELARMRGGTSGLRVVLLMGVVVAVTLGGARLLRLLDPSKAYAVAAAQLERSDTDQRDAFMRCALPTYQRSQLSQPGALRVELERATDRQGSGYGAVLASCAPLLASFQYGLRDLRGPANVRANLAAVARAADDLGQAFRELESLLRGAAFDSVRTRRALDKVELAWQSYLTTRDHAKQALAEHL